MKENKTPKILIKPFSKFDPETKKEIARHPEEKQYILLLYYNSNYDGNDKTFEVITGRTFVREFLIERISEIDIESSYVLVEDVPFKDSFSNQVTVYKFLKTVQKYYKDGFDVDDYYISSPTAEDLNDNNDNHYVPEQDLYNL